MTRKLLSLLALVSAHIYAQEIKTPAQIQLEINQAEHDFQIAQKMFIPYYTGPLITSSAHNIPPKMIMLQPYLYTTLNYAAFDGHRHSHKMTNNYLVNPLVVIETGITNWLDVTLIPQGYFRFRDGHSAQRFGDFPVQLGFQIYKETPYVPAIRMILGEVFPTGQYQWLDPDKGGIDSSGSGTYISVVGLNVSKIFWWFLLHPIAVRFATNYNVPNRKAHVHSFNAYGGGYGTRGKVKVGNTFNADLGIEVSLNQKWVVATDIAYTCSNKSSFRGINGKTPTGEEASSHVPSSDQLSISPAIEYNVSDSGGFIGGVWFPITGRNSNNFVSLVLSYYQVF